ncbi:MAG: hypothetical protein ACREMU_05445, partial [Gemmatimonadaceae bacterium]
MSTAQQWQWDDDAPRTRLSEAELGATLFSTRQGRRMLTVIALGAAAFLGAWMKAPHVLAVGFAPM